MKIFEVNYGDNDCWSDIEADDARDAAERCGKNYNENGDYSLMNDSMYVRVRENEDSEILLFCVSAESSIDYYSREQTNPIECKQCKKDCRELIIKGEMSELYDDRFCGEPCYAAWREDYKKEMEEYRLKTEAQKNN